MVQWLLNPALKSIPDTLFPTQWRWQFSHAVRIEGMYISLKSEERTYTIPVLGSFTLNESATFHFTVGRVGVTSTPATSPQQLHRNTFARRPIEPPRNSSCWT
jgi:hypothetical protein